MSKKKHASEDSVKRLLDDVELLKSRITSSMALGFKKHGNVMTVSEFFDLFVEKQAWHLAMNARERLKNALGVEGYSRGALGVKRSNFLGSRLLGIDHFLADFDAAVHAMAGQGQMGKSGAPSGIDPPQTSFSI